jgi:hypothetical protein
VLPVVLFHAGFDVFSSGCVGVDIFNMISGYLITALLTTGDNLRRVCDRNSKHCNDFSSPEINRRLSAYRVQFPLQGVY